MIEKETIPLYESTPTVVVSTRLPVPSKIQLMELAMKYKMTQGEYMAYMVVKILQNPDAFDPKKLEEAANRIVELEALLRSAIESSNKYQKAYQESELRVQDLESDLEALRADLDEQVDEALSEGKNVASKAVKSANAWMSKAKELEKRLAEANKRLAAEDIRDGSGLFAVGKVVQF